VVRRFDDASKGMTVLAASPDGKLVVSKRPQAGELQLWDAGTGKLLHDLGFRATHVEFSPDSKILRASQLIDVQITRWKDVRVLYAVSIDVATARQVIHFQAKDDDTLILAFSPDGKLALTERSDPDPDKKPYLVLWDLAIGKEVRQFEVRQGGERSLLS